MASSSVFDGEMKEQSDKFRKRVKKELEAYFKEYEREANDTVEIAGLVDLYTKEVMSKIESDNDFVDALFEEGDVDSWENDWVREFIFPNIDLSAYVWD